MKSCGNGAASLLGAGGSSGRATASSLCRWRSVWRTLSRLLPDWRRSPACLMMAELPRERRLCQGLGRWRAMAGSASATSLAEIGGGDSEGALSDDSGCSRAGNSPTALAGPRSVGSVSTRATKTANRKEKANAAQTSRRNMMPMGMSETNTASAVAVLTIQALRVRPLSKTSEMAPRRNAGTPTAAAITMRTPPSPAELSRFTHMTTTLVATARDDKAAPARTPPSCRERGLRRWGTITPVDPCARAEPAPYGNAGAAARQRERERNTCGSLCGPATSFGSGRERRGDRKLAAHSHQRAGTPSIPPRKTVFYRTAHCGPNLERPTTTRTPPMDPSPHVCDLALCPVPITGRPRLGDYLTEHGKRPTINPSGGKECRGGA